MSKQQTAVEWLISKIKIGQLSAHEFQIIDHKKVFQQAKEMEREQIEKAHGMQYFDIAETVRTGKQYYEQTYGKETDSSGMAH